MAKRAVRVTKGLLAAAALVPLLLAGCSGYSGNVVKAPTQELVSQELTPAYTPIHLDNEPPRDSTWISPGKVNVANYFPSATAQYPVTIHNGNSKTVVFNVSYRVPDNVAAGYEKAPVEAQDWVIVTDATPLISPKGTVDIMVTLAMPKGSDAPDRWEFWVSVSDSSQTGTVRTELCVRWLVEMR